MQTATTAQRARGAPGRLGRRPQRSTADARLGWLALGLAVVAVGLLVSAEHAVWVRAPAWAALGLAAAFGAAEATQLHVEFRNETFSVSLSELPLVLGLFVATPGQLVLARLAGAAVVFAVRRTPPRKAAFNLALFAAEAAAAAAMLSWLGGTGALTPRDWLVTYAAVAAAETASTLAVFAGMLALSSRPSLDGLRRVMASVAAAAVLNTTLALLVLIVLEFNALGSVLLALVGGIVVLAYRVYSSLLRKHTNLGQLFELSKELAHATSYDVLLPLLLERCRELLRAERVVLRDPAEQAADPMLGRVLASGRPAVLSRRARQHSVRAWLRARAVRDAVLMPLSDGDALVGVLQVENRLGEMSTFTSDDARLLQTIGANAQAALRGVRLLERLRYDAEHDSLTGLGNRTLLYRRIEDELRAGTPAAVVLLDLDRFKEVNDSLGHRIGDLLLAEVARRLVALVGGGTVVARLGGDEFAMLLPGCTAAAEAEDTARALLNSLGTPFEVANTTLEVGASAGIALLPDHGQDAVSVLQHADVAMYAAKRSSRAVALYSSDADAANLRRLALSRELRRGIEAAELVLHYQPKLRLGTAELIGVEALARWEHPVRGRVMPDEFIPVAEQTGLIGPLTEQVLATALHQVRRWLDAGSRLGVAVNLSPRGLLEAGLVEQVRVALAVADVPPELLTLEITESSVMADFDAAVHVLDELCALGVRLSLDDFGTGYSSLAYLQRLPVTEVKIDKSFVMRMTEDQATKAIVRSVVQLAHTLGLAVVAEGVEDQATWDTLSGMGCDSMQGYLLSRPLPVADLTEWLHRRTRRLPAQLTSAGAPGRLRVLV